MQPNSIQKPTRTENAQTQNPFPASGDNFTTLVNLDGIPDPMALLEAIAFIDDCAAMLAAVNAENRRIGTV